jgi:hypothetical protein
LSKEEQAQKEPVMLKWIPNMPALTAFPIEQLQKSQTLRIRHHGYANTDEYPLQVTESMLVNNPTDAAVARGVGSIESHGQSLPRNTFSTIQSFN